MNRLFKNNENGIAIMFTLGILCLIIVTILTFIAVNSLEHKAAKNYNNLQFARVVAQSTLREAIASVRKWVPDYSKDANNIGSRINPSFGIIPDAAGVKEALTAVVDGVSNEPSQLSDWVYVYADTPLVTPIIGRYAYRVIGKVDAIDPSACLDSGQNYKNPSVKPVGEDESDNTSLCADGSTYVVGRPGVDVNEVSLRCMDTNGEWINSSHGDVYLKKISSKNAKSAGKMDGTRWNSVYDIVDALNVPTGMQNYYYTYFCTTNPPDPEAFWYDVNRDGIQQTSGELYDRFNIARTDWDSLDTSAILDTSKITLYDSSGTTDGNSIPWIANWNYSADTGNFVDTSAKRAQIAANLIDYCDRNDTATTDGSGDGSGTAGNNKYTYVGLEKCPYINEVRIMIEAKVSIAPNGAYYNITRSITPIAEVEVVDMYGRSMDTVATVYIDYQFNWNVGYGCVDNAKKVSNIVISVPIGGVSKGYGSGSVRSSNTDTRVSSLTSATYTSVYGIMINSLRVKLNKKDTGEFLDFAYIVNPGKYSSNVMEIFNSVSPGYYPGSTCTGTAYIDFRIDDPRQNLNYTDWGTGEWSASSVHGISSTVGTIGHVNGSVCVPNSGTNADSEPVAVATTTPPTETPRPWNVSTAYIRNDSMKSPWELGMIHRGTKWQTINLKRFNPAKGVMSALKSGGGRYTEGDANILDQIKMTPNTQTYGKFNVNSKMSSDVFKALFENIFVGSDILSTGEPGTLKEKSGGDAVPLDHIKAKVLADAVKEASLANTNAAFDSRAEVLSTCYGVLPLTSKFHDNSLGTGVQTCDAQQEEIIGKFINLTKALIQDDTYNVIITAQAIKEVQPSTPSSDSVKVFYTDTNGIVHKGIVLSTQKVVAKLIRLVANNRVYVESFKYQD